MLSILGLTQCVYVLVYMLLRSGSLVNAIVPSLYFLLMGFAFFVDVASSKWMADNIDLKYFQWLFWFSGIPVGVLLILQIAQIHEKPQAKYFLLLLAVPISFFPGYWQNNMNLLYITGLIAGALCLLTIWLRRDLLDGLRKSTKFGQERFWLIMALMLLSTAFLGFTLSYASDVITSDEWLLVRTLLGGAFVYLAGTSLFRIYPQALKKEAEGKHSLSLEDLKIMDRLEDLFEREKIYQDPVFGRAELARELGTGEANLSRMVNQSYGKTIPQMLNELRVKDAQRLLKDTDVSVQAVFEESGFNSVTTFNRVFKEICGETPKEYRAKFKHECP